MALKDCTWSESRNYRNGSEAEPLEFFLNGLTNSTSLSLLLGYFSSTAISHLAYGFAHFISNGGKVRIVLNQILSPEDKIAIQNSENIKSEIPFDLSDFSSLERVLNKYDKHFFECLSYLISQKRIEFKIIKPLNGRGISHYKSGVFEDGEDKVCYEASCNFTYFGLNRNLERLTSFLSWEGNRSKLQCKETLDLINGYFNESEKNVQYLDTENIQEAIYQQFGSKDINELVVQEKEFIQQKSRSNLKYKISKLLEKVMDGGGQGVKPSFPYSTGPRDYQLEAYEQWMNSGKIGLFNMATGTGKTITALNCLLKESQETGLYKAIILVPTNTLANQWQTEVSDKFNFKEVYFCNSTNRVWKEELKHLGDLVWLGRNPNYVIITTYETFKGELFQNIFKEKFYSDYSSQLLIADEAHAMGSIGFLKVIPEYITRRIGLSATPFRQYDEVGNDKINNYFNITDSQYTYEYNMKKAINNGVLSQYYYYPKIVSLTSEEQEQYIAISRELVRFIDPKTGLYRKLKQVEYLLLKRKSIIHKAENKLQAVTQIINEIGKDNFKNAFIYVPEGELANYDHDISVIDDAENSKIIDKYIQKLHEKFGLRLSKFTGETDSRDDIIRLFKQNKYDALVAMKCLDEGIDIPQAEFAIFCSSTGNPRQYIQRRGRVLRKYKGKEHAVIYDLIVKPTHDITGSSTMYSKIERNLFLSEIRRLVNFAVLSENKDVCLKKLQSICIDFDIDIYEIANNEELKYAK